MTTPAQRAAERCCNYLNVGAGLITLPALERIIKQEYEPVIAALQEIMDTADELMHHKAKRKTDCMMKAVASTFHRKAKAALEGLKE
jgi:hypothetical protein